MNWNWQHFFEQINNINKFKESIEQMKDYADQNVKSYFFKTEDYPQNLLYSTWSNKFFRLKTSEEEIAIDKRYLLFFLDDYIKETEFYQIHKDKKLFKYISYEFMLEMHLAKDSSSGGTKYNSLFKELIETLNNKSISIKGSPLIKTRTELDNFLKKSSN